MNMAIERYSKDHEYIRVEGDIGTVGITHHAQEQLGDVVFVEVPEVGKKVKAGDQAAVVESVKAASEIYAPVSGEIIAANADLAADPAMVNQDPMGKAWFMKIKLADKSELDKLMDKAAYDKFLAGSH
jgi:glycine cleavage system H protein